MPKVVIIGSGIGGLSLGIRLQAMNYQTVIVEKLDKPGGRAYQKIVNVEGINGEFKFDMGPTVLTVPHFIEELFALQKNDDQFSQNFPPQSLENIDKLNLPKIQTESSPTYSSTNFTKDYVEIVPILPFYRIYFDDGTFFDYDGDIDSTIDQIRKIDSSEVEGYFRFQTDAKKIFERGFLELGYTYFGDINTMLKIAPDLFKLDAVRNLFSFASKYFKNDKLRQVFSFETLLIGGNPLKVPAIYAMIHFVEKTWGIHYSKGGTGALIKALVKKYEELGGQILYDSEVEEIVIQKSFAEVVELENLEKDILESLEIE